MSVSIIIVESVSDEKTTTFRAVVNGKKKTWCVSNGLFKTLVMNPEVIDRRSEKHVS